MSLDVVPLLEQAGVHVLYERGDEVYGRCPNPDHDDSNPSWSINSETLAHHCFSCGYGGSLQGLLLDLTGEFPDDLALTLKTQRFVKRAIEFREDRIVEQPVITEWALGNLLKRVPPKLLALRRLAPEACDYYQVRWDGERKQWVLPIRDADGRLLGAQYRQKGSVQTLPAGLKKSQLVFGFHQATQHHTAAVTESPLDAVRLHQCGMPAFSTLGAYVSREQMDLMASNFRRVVIALDNDNAGREAAEILSRGLRKRRCVPMMLDYSGLTDEDGAPAKDPGDVADDGALSDACERAVNRYNYL
jgi:DNA primase